VTLAKKIGGIALIAFAIFPFFGFPAPKEIAFLGNLEVRIIFILIGLAFLGFGFFFTKRNIAAIIMFLLAIGFLIPVPFEWRIILFIYSLDLITVPFLEIPFFNIGRILGRIILIIFLFFLSSFRVTSLLKVDIGLAIMLVIILTVGEILASIFLALGDFIVAAIKAAIVFVAALYALKFNTAISGILAVGIFILNVIL